jgi:3-phosphoshikimate 1-carboxyvinyltransferase
MTALRVTPGGRLEGEVRVPGDKSIAHRWLLLAATARGRSRLVEVPPSLDVRSTASCLAAVAPAARGSLEGWLHNGAATAEGHGSTWNPGDARSASVALEVEGEGREALAAPEHDLHCGNSGTSMRLLTGLLAGVPFRTVLTGDDSLRSRPMERVAAPLREMGADVDTTDGHAPIVVHGGPLHGIRYLNPIPSAQVKSAVLLAGLAAEGETVVEEPAATRDHTERALAALGGPVLAASGRVSLRGFQHQGFAGRVPGDPSSAAFLVAAAALTGSEVTIREVGLNPTRTRFLVVLSRMGVHTRQRIEREEVGEPVGELYVERCDGLSGTRIEPEELPLVIDEVPVLAALAAHASGETWFLGASELRVKESDRIAAIAGGLRSLGGHAGDAGPDLVVAGGGLRGGRASAGDDHRMAMAFVVAALAASGPSWIDGADAADVSFPGFAATLRGLGASLGRS